MSKKNTEAKVVERVNVFSELKDEINFDTQVREKSLEYLSEAYERLMDEEKSILRPFRKVGVSDTEQDTDWHGELRWEDDEHTIPIMKPIYDYMDVTEADLDEYEKVKLAAVRKVLDLMATLKL